MNSPFLPHTIMRLTALPNNRPVEHSHQHLMCPCQFHNFNFVCSSQNMSLHCHTCALVTSSSHVLGTGAGAEIDQAECVIRMNDAPTMGYETDVGNHTSLRVVAHSSVFRVVRRLNELLQRADNNSVIIFWGPSNKISKEAKGTLYRLIQKVSTMYSNLSCFTVTANKMRRFDNLFQSETGRDR